MKWFIRAVTVLGAALLASTGAALGLAVTGAHAEGPVPVVSDCLTGWYVNGDEAALLPVQQPAGLLFDGPSLVHRAVTPVGLADAPASGGFVGTVQVGVAPLFKLETTAPYSTINKTAAGKYWSSKIAPTDPGGQSSPLDTPAALVGKSLTKTADPDDVYTVDTKIFSFGVGYANDAGNTALVISVTFGATFPLDCQPPTSPSVSVSPSPSVSVSASPTGTTSPTATATATATTAPPTTGAPTTGGPATTSPGGTGGVGEVTATPPGGSLPLTGTNGPLLVGGGLALVLAGAVILVTLWARRHRDRAGYEV